MKNRDGKSQREEKKKEDQKSESLRRKKIEVREKVGKSPNTLFFQWFVVPEGRKVGSLKRRVRSQLARWGMKNCPPLWREAHMQVKTYKAPQLRRTFWSWDVEKVYAVVARSTFRSQKCKNWGVQSTFRSWDVEKVHAVVARSTFRSQKCKKLTGSEHFWKLRCRKNARRCGAKHISRSKVENTDGFGALFDVQMWFRVAGARDCAPCQKWAKREGFVAFPKTMAGVGHLKRICKDALRGTRDMFIRDVKRSGRWFSERGHILEHQIFWFAEMILRHRCGTSYDLASLFRGRRSTLDRWSGKIAKCIGTRPSALH